MKTLTAILILIVTATLLSGCIDLSQETTTVDNGSQIGDGDRSNIDLQREQALLDAGINPETGELIPMTLEEVTQ